MTRLAREYLRKDELARIELIDWPHQEAICPGHIDTVICSLVLQHIPDPSLGHVLDWLVSLLAPDGCIGIFGRDDGDPPDWRPVLPQVQDRLRMVCWTEYKTNDAHSHSITIWAHKRS